FGFSTKYVRTNHIIIKFMILKLFKVLLKKENIFLEWYTP
ncbi:hypothetical protein, partial [Plasmodium yoelii yoelii]